MASKITKKSWKILIVEDDATMMEILSDKLGKEGFEIIAAKDGLEGLKTALEKHPDLLLLDLIMPVMDGLTMLKKIREDKWGVKVPVIILTNLSENRAVADSLESGAYDYLIKTNWTLNDLIGKIKSKLGTKISTKSR